MRFKSIQIWVVGYMTPWDGFEPVKATVFKWHAEKIAKKLAATNDLQHRGVHIMRIPLLMEHTI